MSEPAAQVTIAAPGRIVVGSPLTFAWARRVSAAGIKCFDRDGSASLLVDCAAAAAADSAGLAVLIEWRRWAAQHGRRLDFANLPVQISAIAQLSEVGPVLGDAAA
ncbi:MAG TPA: STAS domain-containing protein [Steroidobacteraceae bacterium]|nr:STAS domain-containing protein [Steroidobacteraceae bacterium]